VRKEEYEGGKSEKTEKGGKKREEAKQTGSFDEYEREEDSERARRAFPFPE
jgi:hypothetical protein